jgi:dTDP-4-dehydrorhamnose 3,5-epimerase
VNARALSLSGLLLIQPKRREDARGFFLERYQAADYAFLGTSFVQDNEVFSHANVLRGLHYQKSPGQAKLISVVQGCIWDVAVDLRPSSPTFGTWEAITLSEEQGSQLFIPVGFAHGYCVLSTAARVIYKVSALYDPLQERSIRWNDPDLAIPWPLRDPLLSERDRMAPLLQKTQIDGSSR